MTRAAPDPGTPRRSEPDPYAEAGRVRVDLADWVRRARHLIDELDTEIAQQRTREEGNDGRPDRRR